MLHISLEKSLNFRAVLKKKLLNNTMQSIASRSIGGVSNLKLP